MEQSNLQLGLSRGCLDQAGKVLVREQVGFEDMTPYDWKNTAHIDLPDSRADILEVTAVDWKSWGCKVKLAIVLLRLGQYGEDSRFAQSRSAIPRTSTEQH
jgi:hypothetical protein